MANQNLRYARNRIRTDLLPYLQTHFNPRIETVLSQTAELLRAEVEYLEAQAAELLEQVISEDQKGLNRQLLSKVPLALQRRVILKFLRFLIAAPNFTQVEALVNLLNAPQRTRTSSLSQGVFAEVQGDYIRLID